jgi:hypothetical protein
LFLESEVLVAEGQHAVVGAATLARKRVWLDGTLTPVTYLFDRMVHPAHRRRGIGRALLQAQLAASGDAALCYSLVLEENQANRALLESEGFTAHPLRLLYLVLLPGLRRPRLEAECYLSEPVAVSAGALLDDAFRRTHALVDPAAASGHGLFQGGSAGREALAVLYRHGAKVFVRAPWYHQWLSRWFAFVPPLHRPVASWSLGHVWTESSAALANLFAGVAVAARRDGVSLVLLPVYENDPRLPDIRRHTVQRWGIPPTRVCLYVQGASAPALLRHDRPILASGRDG